MLAAQALAQRGEQRVVRDGGQVLDVDALRQALAAGRAHRDEGPARRARAQAAIAALARTWSQASMTASTRGGSSAGQFWASTNSSTASTVAAGMDVGNALAQRQHLGLAECARPSACTWRLMLLSATWSRSISASAATPLRASASAAHEPTPPTPTTATRAARSRS